MISATAGREESAEESLEGREGERRNWSNFMHQSRQEFGFPYRVAHYFSSWCISSLMVGLVGLVGGESQDPLESTGRSGENNGLSISSLPRENRIESGFLHFPSSYFPMAGLFSLPILEQLWPDREKRQFGPLIAT